MHGLTDAASGPVGISTDKTAPADGELRKLNTLRGMAALVVLFSHYSNSTDVFGGAFGNGAGQFGVMLFFMLSGFLMSYLYSHADPTPRNIRNFTVSRLARVVPAFYFVCLISFALLNVSSTFSFVYGIHDVRDLASHLLFLYGDSVLWTIPAEIQFYSLFLAIWRASKRTKEIMFPVICVALIYLVYAKRLHDALYRH